MNEVVWLGPEDLEDAETALPELLNQPLQSWESAVSDFGNTQIQRLYRTFLGFDLFLIRIVSGCLTGTYYGDPPRGAEVGRLVMGRMNVAVCDPQKTGAPYEHLLTTSLSPGNWYAHRAGTRTSWCLDSTVTLHVVLCTNPPRVNAPPAPRELANLILSEFRTHYPQK